MKQNHLLIILILLTILSGCIFKYLLNIDELVYNFYSEKLTQEKISQLLKVQKKWEWFGYVIMPLIVLLRSSLVAMCLSIGMFFYNMESKLKFKHFFKVALLGEFVLVLVGFVKLLHFLFIKTDYTLEDIQQFYPISYINFLDIKNLEPWLIYPLQTINLFEIAYFFVLVYGVHKLLKNNYWKSFEITAVSYGTGLVIWLGLVMFLTLNLT